MRYGIDLVMLIIACVPDGWERLQWSTNGGFENQSNGDNVNQHREVIWFSPHCLRPDRVEQMTMFA